MIVWLDGRSMDPQALRQFNAKGTLSDSEAERFALHSLGWISIQLSADTLEVRFDPRAVLIDALNQVLDHLRGAESWLRPPTRYIVKFHTGQNWETMERYEALQATRAVVAIAELGQQARTPNVIQDTELTEAAFWSLREATAVRALESWKQDDGVFGPTMMRVLNLPGASGTRSWKLVSRQGDRHCFLHYSCDPTGPWNPATWRNFAGRSIQDIVPDKGLAAHLIRMAERTMALGQPLFQECTGMIRVSPTEIRDYDWYRFVLPVRLSRDSNSHDAAFVTNWQRRPYQTIDLQK